MRTIQRIPLLLIGLMLAVSAAAQQKKDRGYWSLAFKKTFIEGERSNGNNTGIISGNDGEAQFRVLYDNTDLRYKKDHPGGFEDKTGKTGNKLRRLAITWTKPPQYVKIGEEDKIAFDVKATIDGRAYSPELLAIEGAGAKIGKSVIAGLEQHFSISADVGVMPEVTIGKATYGFTIIQRVFDAIDSTNDTESYAKKIIENAGIDKDELDEALSDLQIAEWSDSMEDFASGRLANNEPWSQNLALGKESYMMVAITTTYGSNTFYALNKLNQKSFTIEQFYLYKYYGNGGDVDNTVRADDDDQWLGGGDNEEGGEDKGTELPPWVIPVAVGTGGAVVGYKFIKRRRKNDEEDPDEPEEEEEPKEEPADEEEEEKEPSTFKMILYKEFGNTLMVGDTPKLVGARIEETTAKGIKKDRPDLTEQIQIEEGSNITIVQTGMAGKYCAANIKVEQLPKEDPMEGDIWFIFRAPGGALRNRVVFNIEDGRIEFSQPNLTLPTGYEETARLPFKIWGASDKAEVKVSISTEEYSVIAEKGDPENEKEKDLWFAVIAENHEVLPPKEERKAGEYTMSRLKVEVVDTNGHTLEGDLPIVRYNMGLVFDCGSIVGCFAEKYNSTKHPFKVMHNGMAVCPHITEATYFLMTWDEEAHQLRRVVPVDDKSIFTVLPLPEEDDQRDDATDYLSKHTRGMTDEEIIQQVGLQFYIKEILDDGSSICCIYARGMLDAPARRKVRLHIETIYENEKYEAEKDVWLTSQPVRQFNSAKEEEEARRMDDRIAENLFHICQFITSHDLLDRIGPVYKLAQILLDGYDPRFGYDREMSELLRTTFLRFVSGETLGANATPEQVEYLGLAAELMQAFAKTNRQMESWLDAHGGVWTRLAIGVATLGWSEPFMLFLRINDKMEAKANHPTKPGGALEVFFVGVAEYGMYRLTEQLWKKTGELGGEFIAATNPNLAANASQIMEQTVGKAVKKLGIFGKDVKVIANDMKNFVTDKFGRQMKSRMAATKTLNNNAAKSANEVIKKYRQSSQWTEEEILEDTIFRAANKQALKDIKEMERACIDYVRYRTPEAKEAFREWCYKMQANKTAQKQLAMYKGDWANNVRSEYYRLLQEDYRIIDKEALADACKRLREQGVKVSEDDMYVFCATNSNSDALHWGDTLTRDRDLSMMFKTKPTKTNPKPLPQEVPQNIAEECYGKAYKKRTGMTMKEGDQAVVQKGSKEMIGAGEKDLNAAFKKEHFNEKFIDLDGVATAYEHKPAEWIQEGARLRAWGDEAGALAKEEEGLRQAIKLYFNSLEKRATYRGTISRIQPKEVQMFQVMKKLEVKTQDPYSISMTDFKKILKNEYNMDITDVPGFMKDLVYRLEA